MIKDLRCHHLVDFNNYNDLHFPIKLENKETNDNEDEEIHSYSKLF